MVQLASIIIVTYNHKNYIGDCLGSVSLQDYPHETIIVDNGSSDGTPDFIEKNFPNVKLVRNTENIGYGAGNNIGVKYAKGEYIVILNPDTVVEKGWLQELVEPLEKNEKLITTSKILLYDGSAINTCGTINHFTGITFTRGLNEDPQKYNVPEFVSGFSGCSFAIRQSDFEKLRGFDENFFLYNEDSDFSWRAHLEGFKILYVPTSVVKHDYFLKVPPEKLYHLEKNRYMLLRKYLSKKDYLKLFPSFGIAEFLTFGYALKYGFKGISYKFRAMRNGIITKVNKVEGNKKNLLKSLSTTIPVNQLTSNVFEKVFKNSANKVFELNYKVINEK